MTTVLTSAPSDDEALLKQHYADLTSKPFFPKLLGYMLSGPVACMVCAGETVCKAPFGSKTV